VVLGIVPHARRSYLDDALAAAEQGFKVWSRTAPAKRAELILEAVRLMRERVEEMAIAMTRSRASRSPSLASADRCCRRVLAVEFSDELAARKVGGALSAGCSIILKVSEVSEETPAGAVQLVQAFADAVLPAGVLNLVFGKPSDISEYLIPQPSVRLVTFTGSVPVGKHLSAMLRRRRYSASRR
jgi:succinate-semialdehyde dehydrogenase/glutarate-semialdehyde dehydrogenase